MRVCAPRRTALQELVSFVPGITASRLSGARHPSAAARQVPSVGALRESRRWKGQDADVRAPTPNPLTMMADGASPGTTCTRG